MNLNRQELLKLQSKIKLRNILRYNKTFFCQTYNDIKRATEGLSLFNEFNAFSPSVVNVNLQLNGKR